MYCEHCGKEITDQARFCENCGAVLEEQHVPSDKTFKVSAEGVAQWIRAHKKLLILGTLVVMLVAGILMGIDYAKTFIDPINYLSIELTGYNGRGGAQLRFDKDEQVLLKLLGKKASVQDLELDENASEEMIWMALGVYYELSEEIDQIKSIFSLKLEQPEGADELLSNGDTVIATIEVDQAALKAYGFRTSKQVYTKTFEIGKDTSSLPEPTKLDLFSIIDLTIDGADGYGMLLNNPIEKEISYDTPIDEYHSVRIIVLPYTYEIWQPYIKFTFFDETGEQVATRGVTLNAEKTQEFTNGEEIVVSILESEAEALSHFGIVLQETEKTITASGLREMEEIDLLGLLEYTFGGTDGYGYIQITPGTYTLPIKNPDNPDKEITVEVKEDEHYDIYHEYGSGLSIPLEFVVHPCSDLEYEVCVYARATPYRKLSNGDEVTFNIAETLNLSLAQKLNAAGLTIKSSRTEVVSGLLEPMEFRLSDIVEYSVSWDEENNLELTVGTTKITELPDNELGVKRLVTTLGEKDANNSKYPITFEVVMVDQTGKEVIHTLTDYIYINKKSWYDEITFDVVAERSLRELRDYGIVIAGSYDTVKVYPESE